MKLPGFSSLLLCLSLQTSWASIIVMDQIGPNATFTNGQSVVHSQLLTSTPTLSDLAVDDFTLTNSLTLTSIQALMAGFGGGTGLTVFTAATEWRVNVYSTAAGPTTTTTGDAASVSVATASITLDTNFSSASRTALVTIPVSIALNPGTYWLAVTPVSPDLTNGQVGVRLSTYAGTPGGTNGFLANPGGGGGFTNNRLGVNSNIAYAITAADPVPEPASALLFALGGAAVVLLQRRNKR